VACAAYNEIAAALVAGDAVDVAIEVGVAAARSLAEDGDGHEVETGMMDGPEVGDEGRVRRAARAARVQGSRLVAEAIIEGRGLQLPDLAEGRVTLEGDGRGYVLDSLRIAVAALADPRPFVDAVVDVVRIGHDTDTNAAIAGGLLGVRDGASAIPEHWTVALQFADEFMSAAAVLVGADAAE
ncbi:MAG: ADP-ribosylglycohydrolase family protein, partial [Dermatophilaceae bacterium]